MADKRGRRRHKQRRKNPSKRRKIKPSREDFISSMPDEILYQVLSFIPTICAIRTSVLSKRWRHVWRETNSIYIKNLTARGINQTLAYFTSRPKILSFHLSMCRHHTATQIDTWIEFAMSRDVQKLSLNLDGHKKNYSFPEFFYNCSSIKQLTVEMRNKDMIPTCTVSWQSLRNLSLRGCGLRGESIAKILSGCPNLESLALCHCDLPQRINLSKSLSLTKLEINRADYYDHGPTEIVAPHIHYLRLKSSCKLSTLADVSSLTEANLDICINTLFSSKADFLQTMVLKMLAKLQNVETLVVGATVLQFLSHAELGGVPFQVLKVKTLIVKTNFVRSVIPGLARILQNSPELKKLIVHAMDKDKLDVHLASYLDKHWRSKYEVFPASCDDMYSMLLCKDSTWKLLLASFIELVLRNAKTLEKMVVRLGGFYFNEKCFKKLLRMVPTLSHNTNVSIVVERSNC